MRPSRSLRDQPCRPLVAGGPIRNPITRCLTGSAAGGGSLESRRMLLPRVLAILLVAIAVALSACGGGDDDGSAPPAREPASASPADFPSAKGKSLAQLTAGLKQGANLAPSSATSLKPGADNRFGFAIVDRANKQLDASQVAVYTARQDG